MNSLIVSGNTIRQFDGLYSLNDLHKAAGNESKHQPALFMRNDQTQALIEELSSTDSQSIHTKTILGKGKTQGTFVAKELVYAYAMWISPKFNLAVIRAYDAMFADKIEYLPPQSMATTYLSEDARSQVGGIVKGIVNKAINEKLQTMLHLEEKMQGMIQTMATGMITNREISVRRGVTAGQVWNRHGLTPVKNGPQWLSGKLVECGCQIEGGGCGELGGKTAKLFDPDKADRIMKRGGLLAAGHKYVSERCGQMSIGFGVAK